MNFPEYSPPLLLRNGHFNTIYPNLFRRQAPLPFQRQRISTPDEDFLDIDFLKANNKRIALLCHGLEGSSSSQYITGTAGLLFKNGWDVAAMNYRFCSGEINRQVRIYHGGATDDVDCVVKYIEGQYEEIALVGFSFGGSLSINYCGETTPGTSSKIRTLVGISVPTDMATSARQISQRSNFIYEQRFLRSLREKVIRKSLQYPDIYDLKKLEKVKTIRDFDNAFTGPINGFKDADDYYQQCSCGPRIPFLKIPTLIINALDDPFLPRECYPIREVNQNKTVTLLMPEFGGHVGFVKPGKEHYWAEEVILRFVSKPC